MCLLQLQLFHNAWIPYKRQFYIYYCVNNSIVNNKIRDIVLLNELWDDKISSFKQYEWYRYYKARFYTQKETSKNFQIIQCIDREK